MPAMEHWIVSGEHGSIVVKVSPKNAQGRNRAPETKKKVAMTLGREDGRVGRVTAAEKHS